MPVNVDAPKDNEIFRITVSNFSGSAARPLVNIYRDGAPYSDDRRGTGRANELQWHARQHRQSARSGASRT